MGSYRGRRIWLLGLVFLTGCSTRDLYLKKQAELEARLDQVVQAQAATNARVTELTGTLADVQSQLKAQGLEVEQLRPGYRELKTTLETTSQKLEKLANESAAKPVATELMPAPVASTTTEEVKPVITLAEAVTPPVVAAPVVVPKAAVEPVKAETPQEAYQKAFRLYMADKFTESLAAFENFLVAYPQHEYAANAQYWIGESLYSLKNYEWAVDAFHKVITKYPKSNKVPDAMLKGAIAHFNMGQGEKGRDLLHRLVEMYPKSAAAGKARERLAREKKK